MSSLATPMAAPPPYSVYAAPPPLPAPTETTTPSLPESANVPNEERQLAIALPAAAVGPARPTPPPPHRATGFMAPALLPSPWEKAPKHKVTNLREGLREGGRSAWAEIREGMKAPVGLTWDGVKQAGPLGLVGGAVCGFVQLGLAPIGATIVFLNHSSRGYVRSKRAAQSRLLPNQAFPPHPTPFEERDAKITPYHPGYSDHQAPSIASTSAGAEQYSRAAPFPNGLVQGAGATGKRKGCCGRSKRERVCRRCIRSETGLCRRCERYL